MNLLGVSGGGVVAGISRNVKKTVGEGGVAGVFFWTQTLHSLLSPTEEGVLCA